MSVRFLLLTIALALFAAPVMATSVMAAPLAAETLFGKSLVKATKISPDGAHLAVTFEEGSQVKLAITRLDDRSITAAFEFGDNMHVFDFWWGSDERIVMSVGKVTGNLDNLGRPASLYAANVDGSMRREIFVMTTSRYQVLHPLPDDDRNILIARYHWADGGEPRGNLLDIYDGDMRFLSDQPKDPNIRGLVADNDGDLRGAVAVSFGDALHETEITIYLKKDTGWEQVQLDSVRERPSIDLLGFSADDQEVYFASNHDMASDDRLGVFRYDLRTRELTLLHRHEHVDVRGLLATPSGKVMGSWASFGPAEYHFFDDQVAALPEQSRLLAGLVNSHPSDNVLVTSSTRDGKRAIVRIWGDRNPGEFFLLDTESMKLSFLSASFPELDKERLLPMEPVRIKARDGLVLNAFLTRPAGIKESLPLIINVHGGPFDVADRWGFNPEAQFFAQHGYATLQVNFRGSGNRGYDFVRAGWREWGGKMQDDITDATHWAIEQGIADPDRICIYGGSYGGYATLMGVIKEPDLYRCGVGYVGVYDLVWFREGDGSDFSRNFGRDSRERFERFMASAVGEDAESLRPVSPVHNVDKIKAELFIVHGAADVRVPIGHAERLREALDDIGKDYEWLVKEKEGHGFYDVDNRVELYTRMLSFFNRHTGTGDDRQDAAQAAP